MLEGFTGYLLPWDQTAYWATVVGINLNGDGARSSGRSWRSSCAAGPRSGRTRWPASTRCTCSSCPGALFGLIGLHLYLVVRLGVTSPPWSKEAAGRERPEPAPTARRARRAGPAREGGREVSQRDATSAERAEFKRYKEDVKKRGKPFYPYAMFHDTVMSLVVVMRDRRARRASGTSRPTRTTGADPGWLGLLYTEKADPGTTNFIPRPDWYFYFLFYLLRIFKWPDSVILGTVGIPTIC